MHQATIPTITCLDLRLTPTCISVRKVHFPNDNAPGFEALPRRIIIGKVHYPDNEPGYEAVVARTDVMPHIYE